MSRPDPARFSAARLAAVQALYSMEITSVSATQALDEANARDGDKDELAKGAAAGEIASADTDLLAQLVRGTAAEQADIDHMIAKGLTGEWTVDRLEAILRAVLRVGIWELKNRLKTPARVIVSEYVDLARAFYAGSEPNLVNAVLDRLARVLRPGEFEANHGRQTG